MERNVFAVSGMTCSHCVSAVQSEVTQVPGVREVAVDLDAGQVIVSTHGAPDLAALRAAVQEAGYQLTV